VSQENVEILRRSNAALRRGDLTGIYADFDSDVEWRDLQHAPDMPECVHGLESLSGVLQQWLAAFDSFAAEVEEYIDAGDAVVTITRWHGTGKESGLPIDAYTAEVYEFADGRVVRVTAGYPDRAAALKAVGLEE
jgi:uncharacterized protein